MYYTRKIYVGYVFGGGRGMWGLGTRGLGTRCQNRLFHTTEGASIIALNETCRGYANRDILIPGRIAGRTQYSDFIPTSILKEPKDDSENNNFIKTMKFHHVKTNQMRDLNDITVTQEQVEEQIQQTYVLSLLLKFVTSKTRQEKYEDPLQLEEKWTQVNTNDLLEATAPSEKVLATIPEEFRNSRDFHYRGEECKNM
ncbi:Envelope fusion protein [Aphis craccivora]|uniref:Envelope fusion protein n=1 Tax=Aphis craccivora TaxID=307492 RepID=A0A6G0VJH3_APHCR|nr:Envelope fusion protein [Aphis craccivora]